MIQDDYILALIERIGQIIARALGREVEDTRELDEACRELVGLPLDLIERLDRASLDAMFGAAPPERQAALGMLLIGRGEAMADAGHPDATERLAAGLHLAASAAGRLPDPPPALLAAIGRAQALTSGHNLS